MNDRLDQFDHLELILKITERCNIDCTYCYMFNKGNNDFEKRPPLIEQSTVEQLSHFIETGISDLGIKEVTIVLHGGEPMMLGKRRFRALCDTLTTRLGNLVTLHIGIQTNGILIDSEWIEIFSEYKIGVGVSLDGPKATNDRYRIDKKGDGTYNATIRGINQLRDAYNARKIQKPGLICVIDPSSSARECYRHFVQELGFTNVSFNLPMETVDSAPAEFGESCARYLTELFDEWVADERTDLNIRLLDQLMRFLVGEQVTQEILPNFITHHLMVVVAADGEMSEHDDFKIINFAQRGGSIFDTTLAEFARSELRRYIHEVAQALPDDCTGCDWRNYCRAGVTHGLTVSRYSDANGFNNRSALCEGFDALYERAVKFLLKNGFKIEILRETLGIAEFREESEHFRVPEIPKALAPSPKL